jgi:hypothetical protein
VDAFGLLVEDIDFGEKDMINEHTLEIVYFFASTLNRV